MAGGMILIGVLSFLLPITSAMILHGVTQVASNSFRAFLLRQSIRFKVLPTYILGALLGFSLFSLLKFVPSKSFVLIAVGLFLFIALLMPKRIPIDIMRGHLIKLVYYGQILYFSQVEDLEFPYILLPIAILTAFMGTRLGKIILDRLSELQFQRYSRVVIALIGGFYFLKGFIEIM